MGRHALLSASSSKRWLSCTPSARLEEQFKDEPGGSVYAEEGTAAHALAEHKLKKALKRRSKRPVSDYHCDEMEECTDGYVAFAMEQVELAREECKDPVVLIEQRLDYSAYVPEGFGTGDLLIVEDKVLTVIDLKYGKGVAVEAEWNPQMMLYGLGALELFDALYDIEVIRMTIYQPRLESVSTWEVSVKDLMEWVEMELKPKAVLAIKGEGEFHSGDWCRFCRAKNTCRARAEEYLRLAQMEFKQPPLLTDEEIAEVLKVADELAKWSADVYAYAQDEAVTKGKKWAGFKLVEGRSNRKYTDEDCEDGKIDMVVTKSISRFARNTQDCLQYSRKLKNLGIGIFFEKENINTLDAAGELLFTIMSSLAQEESRSISENCRWGIRTKFKQGVMHLNANHFLGYDKDEKGNLVINEAQAAIVRRVFDEFMNGLNPEVIAAELNGEGVPGCMGEPKWAVSTIMHILENEKYKGDALLQKYYTSDFLSKKSVRNMGQIEQVYVKDSHPPIVDKELWEAVQLEIERRRLFREKHNLQNMGRYTDVQPFTCRVICGKCGAVFWRRTWTRGSRKIRVWQCGQRYRQKGVAGCKSSNLYEKDLEKAFLMAWNGIVENRESFLPAWKKQITEGNALEKWRAGQMMELTAEPPLETVCPEIVNMVLESVEVHDGGILHFHFLDGTELEIETEE